MGVSSQMGNEAYDILSRKAYWLMISFYGSEIRRAFHSVLGTAAFPAQLSPCLLLLMTRSRIGDV